MLVTALGMAILSELFKLLFQRPRPPASVQLVHQTGYGFPSFHAMAMISVGVVLWYLFSLRPPESWGGSWQATARAGLAVASFALLVGFGRVYEGASYPSDVLAGWALGGVWVSVCLTAAELYRRLRLSGEPLPEAGVQYAQFSLIGVSNASVDLGAINLLLLIAPTRSPQILVLYNLVALVMANANSYIWNTHWTFRRQARHDARQLSRFAVQAAVSMGVGSLVLWLVARGIVAYADLSALVEGNIAKLSSMLVGSTTSFLLLRTFVFRKGP